jgi:hypothetical protein
MKPGSEEAKLLQHLAQEWRGRTPRKSWAFDWQQLHALGQELGHDAAAVERIIRQLELTGSLKDKAPDWGVMGERYVLTDRGIQAALRPQAAPGLPEGSSTGEQPGGGAMSWRSSIADWWGRATTASRGTELSRGGGRQHRSSASSRSTTNACQEGRV